MAKAINDQYMKVILTVIAIALCVIAINPWLAPSRVSAVEVTPVKIVAVDSKAFSRVIKPLKVEVVRSVR